VTLLGETAEDVAEAQREMVRIGIDRPAAMAAGDVRELAGDTELVSFPRATFGDLAGALRTAQASGATPPVVLDVRRDSERAGAFVTGSVHLPIHEVLDRLDEIPAGPVWVHCAGGYRAGVVAALLHARGRHVVAVDDGFDQALPAGLPLTCTTSLPKEIAA